MPEIRVLIVDDSPFIRKALLRIFESEPSIVVVGVARNGKEAIEKVIDLEPDVITLDIMMPGMDGIETLKVIMETKPTPVLMLSQYTHEGTELTLNALEFGAMDFVDKSTTGLMDFFGLAKEIISKVKAITGQKPLRIASSSMALQDYKSRGLIDAVAIGTSTGGPPALQVLLPKFPKDISFGVLIVQHMPHGFTGPLAKRLDTMCQIHIKEAEEGDKIEPGVALIAPSGLHMTIKKVESSKLKVQDKVIPPNPPLEKGGRGDLKEGQGRVIKLDVEPLNFTHRPSVDVLFQSVADNYGSRSIGVILTGMGSDGAKGIRLMKEQGAVTLAQDEETSTIFGMPKVAIESGVIDKVVPITSMAEEIMKRA
ncbi:MAG: chemotaxis response regulator protein-glutamate methylesterase [Thermodesulfovibrionales bacterium]|nr:chemotaxis response regulator protein-glutamate methylesterase [Thermodesulfovibrionales bacterium]